MRGVGGNPGSNDIGITKAGFRPPASARSSEALEQATIKRRQCRANHRCPVAIRRQIQLAAQQRWISSRAANRPQPVAVPQQGLDHGMKFLFAQLDRQRRHVSGKGRIGQRIRQHPPPQLHTRPVIQHRETRRNVGLDRETGEQRLGKAVERLHRQPAARIDHSGEQTARPRPQLRIRHLAQRQQVGVETGIIAPHPPRQPVENPPLHFCRRRLRKGQAQQSFRRGPGQQQTQDTCGQHLRLAGSRRCRHPRIVPGVGGNRLLWPQREKWLRGHSPRPSHSATRARWS